MDRKKIIELALETLQARQAAVAAEISQLRSELAQSTGTTPPAAVVAKPSKKRRSRTVEERRRHSEKMKQIWAARKAHAAKRKPAKAGGAKRGAPSAANLARAEKMKAYWAKRKKETK
jgi:hypothetical protein